MQFTTEVTWTLSDFVVAGVLLFGTGLTYALVARKGSTTVYRVAVGVAVLAMMLRGRMVGATTRVPFGALLAVAALPVWVFVH